MTLYLSYQTFRLSVLSLISCLLSIFFLLYQFHSYLRVLLHVLLQVLSALYIASSLLRLLEEFHLKVFLDHYRLPNQKILQHVLTWFQFRVNLYRLQEIQCPMVVLNHGAIMVRNQFELNTKVWASLVREFEMGGLEILFWHTESSLYRFKVKPREQRGHHERFYILYSFWWGLTQSGSRIEYGYFYINIIFCWDITISCSLFTPPKDIFCDWGYSSHHEQCKLKRNQSQKWVIGIIFLVTLFKAY